MKTQSSGIVTVMASSVCSSSLKNAGEFQVAYLEKLKYRYIDRFCNASSGLRHVDNPSLCSQSALMRDIVVSMFVSAI